MNIAFGVSGCSGMPTSLGRPEPDLPETDDACLVHVELATEPGQGLTLSRRGHDFVVDIRGRKSGGRGYGVVGGRQLPTQGKLCRFKD